ncbi:MAG TPA: hypothetical protein VGG08_05120 [Solirubrobacteraceae bacterium]|jgi:hypothetical protein
MRITRLIRPALSAVAPLAALSLILTLAPAAQAGEPATVTVRVESFEGVTLVPQTTVTTTATAVPVEGGTCNGTSAGGALYDAVHGKWLAKKASGGVEILGIEGIDLPPFGEENYAYWALWLNSTYAAKGACAEELSPGEPVVFVAQCFAIGTECPTSSKAPEHFLTETVPSPSDASVGEPVTVTIGSLSTVGGKAQAKLPVGVTVSDGSTSVEPNASGEASFMFASPGTYTLQAHGPSSVPSDPYTVCVHEDGGSCGTTPDGSSSPPPGSKGVSGSKEETKPSSESGSKTQLAIHLTPVDKHSFPPGRGPRVIAGKLFTDEAISSVRLSLRRSYHGRCWSFNARRARFLRARCGRARPFTVAGGHGYSYLLPHKLPAGSYVLEAKVTGVSRSAVARSDFYVR